MENDKPKSKRTVAEWQAVVDEASARAWRAETIVYDTVFGDRLRSRCGLRVVVTLNEKKQSLLEATVFRPLGARPVIRIVEHGSGEHGAKNVVIDDYEDWCAMVSAMDSHTPDQRRLKVLHGRVTEAVYRYQQAMK